MPVTRIKITLEQWEYSALLKLAKAQLRNPEDQARHIVRQELRRCGLIQSSSQEERQMRKDREYARRLMKHYFSVASDKIALNPDCMAEIECLVDAIIDAAVEAAIEEIKERLE